MNALSAILLVAAAGAEPCPFSLVLNVEGLSVASETAAQAYADCISQPWLPTAEERPLKLAECVGKRPAGSNGKLAQATAWVDKMAANFPTCETHLEIKKKSDAEHH